MTLATGLRAIAASVAVSVLVAASTAPGRVTVAEFFAWTDADAMDARAAHVERRVQEAVATCMRDRGFQYQPVPLARDAALDGVSPDAFAAAYGFGITIPLPETILDEVDPNQPYVAGLGTKAAADYARALMGVEGPEGCESIARRGINRATQEVFDTLEQALATTRADIANDSRARQAVDAWSGCATAAVGRAVANPVEILDRVRQHLMDLDLRGVSDLPTIERSIAVAVRDCDRSYERSMDEVIREHEGTFIQRERDLLLDLRDRYWRDPSSTAP